MLLSLKSTETFRKRKLGVRNFKCAHARPPFFLRHSVYVFSFDFFFKHVLIFSAHKYQCQLLQNKHKNAALAEMLPFQNKHKNAALAEMLP